MGIGSTYIFRGKAGKANPIWEVVSNLVAIEIRMSIEAEETPYLNPI